MDEVLAAALEENPLGRKPPPAPPEPEGDKKPSASKSTEVRV
jgi:ATP-dependent Lon protease